MIFKNSVAPAIRLEHSQIMFGVLVVILGHDLSAPGVITSHKASIAHSFFSRWETRSHEPRSIAAAATGQQMVSFCLPIFFRGSCGHSDSGNGKGIPPTLQVQRNRLECTELTSSCAESGLNCQPPPLVRPPNAW